MVCERIPQEPRGIIPMALNDNRHRPRVGAGLEGCPATDAIYSPLRCKLIFPLFDNLQFFQPAQEQMGRGVGLFLVPRPLQGMQYLVALVDTGTRLLFTHERRSIFDIANDPPVDQPQFRREIEFYCHDRITTRGRKTFHAENGLTTIPLRDEASGLRPPDRRATLPPGAGRRRSFGTPSPCRICPRSAAGMKDGW